MPERKSTGGSKEFSYTKEDLERIRKTDTGSTKEFKDAYRKWQEERIVQRQEERHFAERRRNLVFLLILLFLMIAVLLILRFFA